jgi:hypothetical protein
MRCATTKIEETDLIGDVILCNIEHDLVARVYIFTLRPIYAKMTIPVLLQARFIVPYYLEILLAAHLPLYWHP